MQERYRNSLYMFYPPQYGYPYLNPSFYLDLSPEEAYARSVRFLLLYGDLR